MNNKVIFPEGLADFLYWVKETTESYWHKVDPQKSIYGAKWLPLSEAQIDGLESKYSIKFDVEHRTFLRILHTIDKYYDQDESGQQEEQDPPPADNVATEEMKKAGKFRTPPYRPSFFYNWLTDKEWIESRLTWVGDHFIDDILSVNRSWLRSWGPRPESDDEKIRIFREWYHQAPRLLPIKAHTFLMADGGRGLRPVMSVYGFDTIISAWSLRHFLIRELGEELGLTAIYYDEDYPEGYKDLVKGNPELDALQAIRLDEADIPYWKEPLTYYQYPGRETWQGFGIPWSIPKS
ncbi:hypothetical protein HF324_33035 [Chitinophaga oryzae]|uniref:Knr4/Smi1-like domain-containing protein n=2 Tax=Chitinophaga oryzae TaxID=2725414 RepID=A0ABX6LR61_9BACT|nr:hypothetical protein [Chitinophaga oryzae]QJB42417.1 hypothetical protein HF324_33035 [Chitinophaga oryzae]